MSVVSGNDVKELEHVNADNVARLDAHVVVLNNYVRKHHVVSYQELAKRVRKLTVLLSVPMEPDRDWDPTWEDLDVRVQKNWMLTKTWKHSSGFKEPNYIHIPIDTNSQLKSLKPDIVFSYEMGVRTMLSSWYRRFHRNVPLVMVGNMSNHIECERGMIRRSVRSFIRRSVDYFTYNGPSCKRYLSSLSIPDERMFHVPYCIDPDVVNHDERSDITESNGRSRKLLYCGALSERKGIVQFSKSLQHWSQGNPEQLIEFSIAGSGPLKQDISDCATPSLTIKFLGNCDVKQLRNAYGSTHVSVFPTLADEWGLVPIEALASGVPVLGSGFAQSVESVVEEGKNGWIFEPTDVTTMDAAIDRAMNCSPVHLEQMGAVCKKSVEHINGSATAERFCDVIRAVVPGLMPDHL